MIAFWIAVVIGVVVAVVYITLAVQAFIRVRAEVLASASTGAAVDLDAGEIDSDGSFTWKAVGAVIFSTLVIVLLGVSSVFWYLPAILAIGSSVAVITAFVVDRRSTT
jgi:predicted metal-binding membrane protein